MISADSVGRTKMRNPRDLQRMLKSNDSENYAISYLRFSFVAIAYFSHTLFIIIITYLIFRMTIALVAGWNFLINTCWTLHLSRFTSWKAGSNISLLRNIENRIRVGWSNRKDDIDIFNILSPSSRQQDQHFPIGIHVYTCVYIGLSIRQKLLLLPGFSSSFRYYPRDLSRIVSRLSIRSFV